MKKLIGFLLIYFALCSPALAQFAGPVTANGIALSTRGALPKGGINVGAVRLVTDTNGSSCTTAGATTLLCRWTGAAWVPAGSGTITNTGGDVFGPAVSTNGRVAVFSGISGKFIAESLATFYVVGGADVAVADGGTGASTAAGARTNLGLVIGTDVLAPTGSAAALTAFPTFNQNTTGTAALATALAGTPTLCNVGDAARGILASGNATGCFTPSGGVGGGISSLNALTGSIQTFSNDTNITITSAGTAHVLGWSGTLGGARGGLGANAAAFSGVLKMSSGVASIITGTATDCVFVNGTSGSCALGSTGITGAVTNFLLKATSATTATSSALIKDVNGEIIAGDDGSGTLWAMNMSSAPVGVKTLIKFPASPTPVIVAGIADPADSECVKYISLAGVQVRTTGGCSGGVGGGIADPGANGMLARTALNVTVARTFIGTFPIDITNGSGFAGAPTIACPTCVSASGVVANDLLRAITSTSVGPSLIKDDGTNVSIGATTCTICTGIYVGGSFVIHGSTSGSVTQLAPAVAGTPVITWGNTTGTPVVSASSPLSINTTTGVISCPTCGGADTDAAADGTTKGVATFTAADFNATAGLISIDYTNGQAATGSVKGFLIAADWTTFNAKLATNGSGASLTGIPTSIIGTANEIAASAATGAVTLSLSPIVNLTSKTLRIPNSTTLPATCAVGDAYMDTDATSGARFFLCESTNTWATEGGSGGGATAVLAVSTFATDNSVLRADTASTRGAQGSLVTISDTGDMVIPGGLTLGTFTNTCIGGTAGCTNLQQGTVPTGSPGANTVRYYMPTSVTAYDHVRLGAACSGLLRLTNVSGVVTETCATGGLSATISVRKGDDSAACNIVVAGGIITSTTC